MMFKKRGQGALEFLMTYGWAFLVILIMIGALAYFGVLSPSRFLPERCSFGSEFECMDFVIGYGGAATPEIDVVLRNSVGETVQISSVTVDVAENDGWSCAETIATPIVDIAPGNTFSINAGNTTGPCTTSGTSPTTGNKYKAVVTVVWSEMSSTAITHTVKGEVFGTVQP